MNLQAIYARIEKRLAELNLSANRVSAAAGVPDAIRNLKRAVKNGKGGITARTLAALAGPLNMSTAQLLGEEASISLSRFSIDQLLEERESLLRRLTEVQNEIAIREQRSMMADGKSQKKRAKQKSR